jgi:hypothetical protein
MEKIISYQWLIKTSPLETIPPPAGIFFWEAGGFSNQEGEKKLEKEKGETRNLPFA